MVSITSKNQKLSYRRKTNEDRLSSFETKCRTEGNKIYSEILEQSYIYGVNLSANFKEQIFENKEFRTVKFLNCCFNSVRFVNCRFNDCQFNNCSGKIILDTCHINESSMDNCNVLTINSINGDACNVKIYNSMLVDSKFNSIVLSYICIYNSSLYNSTLNDIEIEDSTLDNVLIGESIISSIKVIHDLKIFRSDFTDAEINGVVTPTADSKISIFHGLLKGTKFYRVKDANFSFANTNLTRIKDYGHAFIKLMPKIVKKEFTGYVLLNDFTVATVTVPEGAIIVSNDRWGKIPAVFTNYIKVTDVGNHSKPVSLYMNTSVKVKNGTTVILVPEFYDAAINLGDDSPIDVFRNIKDCEAIIQIHNAAALETKIKKEIKNN